MPSKTNACAHPACRCTPPPSEEFCSEYCRNAPADAEVHCRCGHRECGEGAGCA